MRFLIVEQIAASGTTYSFHPKFLKILYYCVVKDYLPIITLMSIISVFRLLVGEALIMRTKFSKAVGEIKFVSTNVNGCSTNFVVL